MLIHFCFCYSKANSHDKEVQRLYEEMEQQIRTEKERIHNEVRRMMKGALQSDFAVTRQNCVQNHYLVPFTRTQNARAKLCERIK